MIFRARIESSRVGALHRDDPRIGAQRIGELSVAHVESIDARRTAAQQHIGEATGRCTHVQADAAARRRCANASSAAASFSPPRETNGARSASANELDVADKLAGFHVAARAVARAYADLAGKDQTRSHVAVRGKSARNDEIIESDAPRTGVRAQALRASIVDEAVGALGTMLKSPDRLAHLLADAVDVDAQIATQIAYRAVVDELVRPARPTILTGTAQRLVVKRGVRECLEHG